MNSLERTSLAKMAMKNNLLHSFSSVQLALAMFHSQISLLPVLAQMTAAVHIHQYTVSGVLEPAQKKKRWHAKQGQASLNSMLVKILHQFRTNSLRESESS